MLLTKGITAVNAMAPPAPAVAISHWRRFGSIVSAGEQAQEVQAVMMKHF
jgi:hypothetical protein